MATKQTPNRSPGDQLVDALLESHDGEPCPLLVGRLQSQLAMLADSVFVAQNLIEQGAVSLAHEHLERALRMVK